MADTGLLESFSFGGTVYDSDDCLQSTGLQDAISEVVYQCGGQDRAGVGSRSSTFTVSLALAKTDTAKLAALAPGATGAFEYHPGGDSAGNIEVTATEAIVTSAPISTGPNSIITLDVTFRLNDITIGAAS